MQSVPRGEGPPAFQRGEYPSPDRKGPDASGAGALQPVLSRAIGATPRAEFFDRYLGREPLFARGAAVWAQSLATVATCERLVSAPQVDVLLVRDGKPHLGARPVLDDARRLFDAGYTW